VVWDSNRVPLSNNPFHRGIPGIQIAARTLRQTKKQTVGPINAKK